MTDLSQIMGFHPCCLLSTDACTGPPPSIYMISDYVLGIPVDNFLCDLNLIGGVHWCR